MGEHNDLYLETWDYLYQYLDEGHDYHTALGMAITSAEVDAEFVK